MDDVWTLVRFLHILGVTVWLGGIVMLGAVVVPAGRALADRSLGRRVIGVAARRFGVVGGVSWLLIAGTGMALLEHRDVSLADLPDSDYGRRLLAKIALLLAMGAVAAVHAAWQGPSIHRAEEAGDAAAARRWRLLGAALDSFLLLGSLAALWLATSLVP